MRFIAGPRQTGKTTLAKAILKETGNDAFYYNWDDRALRMRSHRGEDILGEDILKSGKTSGKRWVCYDEIHKLPKWKNILKSHFDAHEDKIQLIVTGSARLDMFRRSGDSLAGRYFLFRLFPINLFERTRKQGQTLSFRTSAKAFIEERLSGTRPSHQDAMESLLKYGGFPEPLLKESSNFLTIWHRDYLDRLIREDLRDLTRIGHLEQVAALVTLLPERVGSPLSLNSLREDLLVSHDAVQNYLKALRLGYFLFELPPYTQKLNRALTKEKKVYFHDWSFVSDQSKRFENYVAAELLSWISGWHDAGIGNFELRYIKNREGKECDFVILKDSRPWLMVEAKLRGEPTPSHLFTFSKTLGNVPFVILTQEKEVFRLGRDGDICLSAARFLGA